MRKTSTRCALLLGWAVAAAGWAACGGQLDDPQSFLTADGGTSTGCDAVAQVFMPRCSACHSGKQPMGDLDLVSGDVASRLIGQPSSGCEGMLVEASLPAAGVLFDKLADKPACGERMPQGAPALASKDRACLSAWVTATLEAGGR